MLNMLTIDVAALDWSF